jgi:hypothetical protein
VWLTSHRFGSIDCPLAVLLIVDSSQVECPTSRSLDSSELSSCIVASSRQDSLAVLSLVTSGFVFAAPSWVAHVHYSFLQFRKGSLDTHAKQPVTYSR